MTEAKETGKICGVSKRQVLRLKSKHDSDHVDETGIQNERSQKFRKIWEDLGSSSANLIKQHSPDYSWPLSETTARNPHFGKNSH